MKLFKKIQALSMLVLSILMVVPANVFAEDKEWYENPGKATVNIEIDDANKIPGMTISAYRIIDVNIDEDAKQLAQPVYTWRSELVDFIKNYKEGIFIDENNGNAVTEAFCVPTTDGCDLTTDDVKAFYDAVAGAIRGGRISDADVTVPGATGDIEMELGLGNYVVLIEKGVRIYTPSAVNVLPYFNPDTKKWEAKVEGQNGDAKIIPKSTAPTISKTVEDDVVYGNGIGTKHSYKITVTVPQYPDNAINKKVLISDTFDSGLTLDEKSIVVRVDGGDPLTVNTDYKVEFNKDGKTFIVSFSNEQYENVLTKVVDNKIVVKNEITVEYDAVINGNAIVGATGNKNKAELTYSNRPYYEDGYNTPEPKETKVFTYAIKLTKTNEKTGLPIEIEDVNKRAVFTISESRGGAPIKFVGENGVYRKAIENDIMNGETLVLAADADTDTTTELVVAADGTLVITGLAEGDYWVTEIKAPDGYVKLLEPVPVSISDDGTQSALDGIVTDATNDNNDEYSDKEVPNSNEIPVLPVTGGIGTILFSVIGIMLMGLGAFLIKNILKKEDVQ